MSRKSGVSNPFKLPDGIIKTGISLTISGLKYGETILAFSLNIEITENISKAANESSTPIFDF
jgi:hypothetical protein